MIDNTEYLNFSENNNILRIYLGANLKKKSEYWGLAEIKLLF